MDCKMRIMTAFWVIIIENSAATTGKDTAFKF